MAQIRLQPPEPFNFKTPDDWPRWHKRRFQQFCVASGLADEGVAKQIRGGGRLCLNFYQCNRRSKRLLSHHDEYFKVRRNIIYEWARFNRRSQQPDESASRKLRLRQSPGQDNSRSYRRGYSRYRSLRASTTRSRLKPRKGKEDCPPVRSSASAEPDTHRTRRSSSGANKQYRSATTDKTQRLTGRARNRSKSRYSGPNSNTPKHCTRCGKEPHSHENCYRRAL